MSARHLSPCRQLDEHDELEVLSPADLMSLEFSPRADDTAAYSPASMDSGVWLSPDLLSPGIEESVDYDQILGDFASEVEAFHLSPHPLPDEHNYVKGYCDAEGLSAVDLRVPLECSPNPELSSDHRPSGTDSGAWSTPDLMSVGIENGMDVDQIWHNPTSAVRVAVPITSDGVQYAQRLCLVCSDVASGQHYGIASCEACKAFFKRTVLECRQYSCQAEGRCLITKRRRKACPSCRYEKCLNQGMSTEGIRLDGRKGGRHKFRRQSVEASTTSEAMKSAARRDNEMLTRLLRIEPQKVYATPDQSVPDSEEKFMATLSKLADRELVAVISWAKQIPGFSGVPLSDWMNLIQASWLDILCFNWSYRSSTPYEGYLVFADDLKIAECESKIYGLSPEMDDVARRLARKLSSLHVTKEEYVIMKAMILLNTDIALENEAAVHILRDQLFDSLIDYEQRLGSAEALHRVGRLMLTLPLLTHEVVLGRQYWIAAKRCGVVQKNQLLSELVENAEGTQRDAYLRQGCNSTSGGQSDPKI